MSEISNPRVKAASVISVIISPAGRDEWREVGIRDGLLAPRGLDEIMARGVITHHIRHLPLVMQPTDALLLLVLLLSHLRKKLTSLQRDTMIPSIIVGYCYVSTNSIRCSQCCTKVRSRKQDVGEDIKKKYKAFNFKQFTQVDP